jgi:hypothetical protein
MSDALEQVLHLVAEGRLTAAEAEPILAALSDADRDKRRPGAAGGEARSGQEGSHSGPGRVARIQVQERGRSSVDLRIPLSLGRLGLSTIPGLSGAIAERLREAVERGQTGPVLEVADEDGDGVRIVIE